MEKQQLVLPHFLWLMVQNVSIVVNVVEANVFPFARLKICKPACVTLLLIPAKDAAEWYSIDQRNRPYETYSMSFTFFQNLNTSCFVMQPEEMLPDGTPCKTGFCNKGVCEPTMTDIVVRIWGFFEDFNLGSVMRFLKVNIIS